MMTCNFEIKVALLGNVSAGKTTLLNALCRDEFGEISRKQTTAGINYFRIHAPINDTNSSSAAFGVIKQPATRSAESTLTEISEDNVKLREAGEVQEKWFDIELKKELISMRKDTRLVLVDFPGINETDGVNKYKDYVTTKWTTFDGVIVVLADMHGVNSDDQVFLFNLVKDNLKKKEIPVIILHNKVDDPHNDKNAELVENARKRIEQILSVKCRNQSLGPLIHQKSGRQHFSPVYIPISAIHAYIYQCASLMSREQFGRFDLKLIEKLGREQIGHQRWSRLSEEQKRDEAYKLVTERYQDGLRDSNFDKLLKALRLFFGGDETQWKLVEKQIATAMSTLPRFPSEPGDIVCHLRSVYEKHKLLTVSSKIGNFVPNSIDLPTAFWKFYTKYEDACFQTFKSEFPRGFNVLAGPMDELIAYAKLVCLPDWDDDAKKAVEKMKSFVRRVMSYLMEIHAKARHSNNWHDNTHLTPYDWSLVWGSLLLMSYDRQFCEAFGQEKIAFELLFHDANHRLITATSHCKKCSRAISPSSTDGVWCTSCNILYTDKMINCPQCPSCEDGTLHPETGRCSNCEEILRYKRRRTGRLEPSYDEAGCLHLVHKDEYDKLICIKVPDSMMDTAHAAHILWKFCRFMDSTEQRGCQQQTPLTQKTSRRLLTLYDCN
jgi:GTPase SAR1 family protein